MSDDGFVDLVEPRTMAPMLAPELPPEGGGMMITASSGYVTAQKIAVPREYGRIFSQITQLAAAAGHDWFYAWPTKNKDGSTGEVAGLTVKGANAVARLFGNNHLGVSSVQESATHWIIKAQFVDLETGFTYERPFRQRRSQAAGKKMEADRAEDIAFQIGCSKAIRNCVTNAVPTESQHAFDEARRSLVDKIGNKLPEWKARCVQRLSELKVDLKRVERQMGKPVDNWVARDVAKLVAQITAIFDGMATPDDIWPVEVQEPGAAESETKTVNPATGEDKPVDPPASPPPPPAVAETPDLKPPPKPKAPKAPKAAAAPVETETTPVATEQTGPDAGEAAPPADDDFPADRQTAPTVPPPAAAPVTATPKPSIGGMFGKKD